MFQMRVGSTKIHYDIQSTFASEILQNEGFSNYVSNYYNKQ